MHENSSSLSSPSSLDDETVLVNTKKPDKCQNEDDTLELIFQKQPDVTFVVEGVEFPCHLEMLSERCAVLHDIVSIHGFRQRLHKKQRTLSYKQEQRLVSPLPSPPTITVTELRNVEHKIFRALIEFLYTNELPGGFYWDERQGVPFSPSMKEDPVECDQSSEQSQEQSICHSMKFLQRLLIAADRFNIVALKHDVEYKLYGKSFFQLSIRSSIKLRIVIVAHSRFFFSPNLPSADEFLYSFTSAELFVWADSHSCAFLKEKAMDRICRKSDESDYDIVLSKDGWTVIRESKRLLEELFLYARYSFQGVRYVKQKDHSSDYKSNELYYYKVEYLRLRLSELGLDIDGTREMLEERLGPHLDINHRYFLPTKLTKLSEKDTGLHLDQ